MASNPQQRERPVIDIYVTDHARERARQRFPGFKAARIVDEVRAGLLASRVSTQKPPEVHGWPYPDCLYVWNESHERCYPIKAADNGFVVVTTLALAGESTAAKSLREKRGL